MSIESANAFLERVENDEDFKKELEGKTSVEKRIKFAKAQEFDFTKDEIREIMDSLSDEQLDAVAGEGWIRCLGDVGFGNLKCAIMK